MPNRRPPDIIDRILAATASEASEKDYHDRLSFEATIVRLSRLYQYQWDAVTNEMAAYAFFRAGARVAEEMLKADDGVFPAAVLRQELHSIRACGTVAKREAEAATSKGTQADE